MFATAGMVPGRISARCGGRMVAAGRGGEAMWRAAAAMRAAEKELPPLPALVRKKHIDSRIAFAYLLRTNSRKDETMQTIETRYHGATNFKGSRVSASCPAGRVTLPWNHGLDVEENHKAAAERLIRKLGWHGKYAIGATQRGYVFVLFSWASKGYDDTLDDSWSVLDTSGVVAHGRGARYHAAADMG